MPAAPQLENCATVNPIEPAMERERTGKGVESAVGVYIWFNADDRHVFLTENFTQQRRSSRRGKRITHQLNGTLKHKRQMHHEQ